MSNSNSTNTESMTEDTDANDTDNGERQERHSSVRVFAAELLDATFDFKTEDSDRAPKYTLLPTGGRANRVFVTGVITPDNLRDPSDDNSNFVKAPLHDGTDYFYINASTEYQPGPAATLRELDLPARVGVVGKPRHWTTDNGDKRVEIKPEDIVEISENDRYSWVLETARATRNRVQQYNEYTDTPAEDAPSDIRMAREKYDLDPWDYLDNSEEILNQLFLSED